MCQMFCFYNNCFLFFGSGTPHRLLGLQKTKDAQGKPTRPFNKKIQNVLGQDFLQRLWFFLSLCLIAVFCFWIRKPPSATRTRTAKNTKTPEENQKNHKKNQNVWAQDFLQRLEIFVVFVFCSFGSGWCFHRLLGLQRNQNTSGKRKNIWKNRKPRGFSGMSGPRVFFIFFDFFSFLVKLQFLGFRIWKRSSSSATRIVRNTWNNRKTLERLGPGLSSDIFVWRFFVLVAAPHHSQNKPIPL